MAVCRQVYCQLRSDDTEYKSDASPVTVADYAAQAVVNTVLTEAFPGARVVGEEEAASLRDTHLPQVVHLRERITALANSVLESPRTTEQVGLRRLGARRASLANATRLVVGRH